MWYYLWFWRGGGGDEEQQRLKRMGLACLRGEMLLGKGIRGQERVERELMLVCMYMLSVVW